MIGKRLGVLALVSTTLVGFRWASEPASANRLHVANAGVLAEYRSICTVDCYTPQTCGACGHKAPDADPGTHYVEGGSHGYCVDGQCDLEVVPDCEMKHAGCVGGGLDAIVALLQEGDAARTAYAIRSGIGTEVDWARGLITFRNCAGRITASIALTPPESIALAALSIF